MQGVGFRVQGAGFHRAVKLERGPHLVYNSELRGSGSLVSSVGLKAQGLGSKIRGESRMILWFRVEGSRLRV